MYKPMCGLVLGLIDKGPWVSLRELICTCQPALLSFVVLGCVPQNYPLQEGGQADKNYSKGEQEKRPFGMEKLCPETTQPAQRTWR